MTAPLLSIVGPVAAGKTTLAEMLAEELPGRLVCEDVQGNPFLADCYAGVAAARLPAQFYYLASRVEQLARADWPPDGVVVSDYGFCQDRIYAQALLSAEEYRLYDRIAVRLEPLVVSPRVIVHLDASEATLLGRIARRGRTFERTMTAEFLAAQRLAYRQLSAPPGSVLLRVDCDAADLRDAPARRQLVEEVREALGPFVVCP